MPKHRTNPDDKIDAFTFPAQSKVGGTQLRTLGGLTKREHFAGLAMQGFAARGADQSEASARLAVAFADALIETLNDAERNPEA